jgi:hypothetical protein
MTMTIIEIVYQSRMSKDPDPESDKSLDFDIFQPYFPVLEVLSSAADETTRLKRQAIARAIIMVVTIQN